MFRALAGFADMGHKEYVDQQTKRFTQQLPNTYLTGLNTKQKINDTLNSAQFGLGTWDPNTRQTQKREIDVKNYATSLELNQELIDAHQRCKTASLNDLVNTYNPTDRIRCGWIYQKGNPGDQPKISVGALGTRTGPAGFFENPQGTWYWSLEDAQKAVLGDRCAALTNCKNVGAANYAECAFSKTRGVGVPVNARGGVRYPRDPTLTAPASSLVLEPGKCPKPPAPGSPAEIFARSRDVCMPLEDGRLPRDCMLQQITAAGCQTDGSLYQAIANAATPNNYGAGIIETTMYKRYQQMAPTPLLEAAITQGKASQEMALTNFKALAQESSAVKENVLNYAARDMCIKQGTFDKFDFCNELLDGSSPPFAIECLQKEFRRQGGQPAGSIYPSYRNKNQMWDSIGKWGAVKQFISDLAVKTKSSNEKVQREALTQFMGIKRTRQLKQISRIPGVEVFWFNRSDGSFIGRRFTLEGGQIPQINTEGEIEGIGLSDMVDMYVITNLRPSSNQNIRLVGRTKDGIIYGLNRVVNGEEHKGFGNYKDTEDLFAINYSNAYTSFNKGTCWNLVSNGPNYIMGFWHNTFGTAIQQMMYSDCEMKPSGAVGSGGQPLPLEWYTQTQEPDAPMFSWQGLKDDSDKLLFGERRFSSVIPLILSPSVTIEETPGDGIPKLDAVAKLRGTNNGFGNTQKLIGMNSWRTLTSAFYLNSTSTGALLNLGPLNISIENNQLKIVWQNKALSVNTKVSGLIADGKTPHLLVVNMRSDFKARYPNRLTIAVGTFQDWKSGRVGLQGGNSQTVGFTTNKNAALYSIGDAFPLIVGDTGTRATADVSVAWVRLFDYEMNNDDIVRDCNNAWEMAFL